MGAYAVILFLPGPKRIKVGALGEIDFKRGYYVYVGSGTVRRMERHARKGKKRRWHIDYLSEEAEFVEAWYSEDAREVEVAAKMGGVPVPGFGASDSPLTSHLFYFPDLESARGSVREAMPYSRVFWPPKNLST